MTDRRGDGICCRYGLGYFRLLDLEGQVLLQDGDFGDDIALYFSNDETLLRKVPIIEEGTWTVFPNPASNDLYLEFGLEQTMPIKLSIYNTIGQLVQLVENKDFDKGNHRQEIDVTRLSNGLYYLQIEQKGQQIIRRFVVSK